MPKTKDHVSFDTKSVLSRGGDVQNEIESLLRMAVTEADQRGLDTIHLSCGDYRDELDAVLMELCEEGEDRGTFVLDDRFTVVIVDDEQ